MVNRRSELQSKDVVMFCFPASVTVHLFAGGMSSTPLDAVMLNRSCSCRRSSTFQYGYIPSFLVRSRTKRQMGVELIRNAPSGEDVWSELIISICSE
ncbi:hypothetical protein Bca4012_009313 [Brassica carinata]